MKPPLFYEHINNNIWGWILACYELIFILLVFAVKLDPPQLTIWITFMIEVGWIFSSTLNMNLCSCIFSQASKNTIRGWDDVFSMMTACQGGNKFFKWISSNYTQWLKWAGSFVHRHGGNFMKLSWVSFIFSFKLNVIIVSISVLFPQDNQMFFLCHNSRIVVGKTEMPRAMMSPVYF